MQSFEEWLEVNNDELTILFAENGADREMDFDFEEEALKVFNLVGRHYLKEGA